MEYSIDTLEGISFTDLRNMFTLPGEDNFFALSGKFIYQSTSLAQALAYIPKRVTTFYFEPSVFYSPLFRWQISFGDALPAYVAALPASIKTVIFDFKENDTASPSSWVIHELAWAVSKLPKTVTHVELRCEHINDSFLACTSSQKRALFASVPDSVQSFHVSGLSLGALPFEEQDALFKALHSKLLELRLLAIDLHQADDRFLSIMPQGLKQLELSYNELHQKSAAALAAFLAFIPPWIKTLRLQNNQLNEFNLQDLETILSAIPPTVKTLDLNDNGLLMLSAPSFQALLGYLAETVTTIGISEYDITALDKEDVKARFALIPSPVKALTFMSGNLFGMRFSVADFVEVLHSLPDWVGEIDLSQNLSMKTDDDLIYLVSHLPASTHTLRLNNNNLAIRPFAALKRFFESLTPQIRVLDVSGNGFERLPAAQRRVLLNALPPTVKTLITGGNEFALRNDGALIPLAVMPEEHLITEKRFTNQNDVAPYRIVLMQFIRQMRHIPFELQLIIFSYVFSEANTNKLSDMITRFSALIISSIPPDEIKPEHEEECLSAVYERISQRKPDNPWLDLSRCGLNRLITDGSQSEFDNSLNELPRQVTCLKLRGNGFLTKPRSRRVFLELMPRIPDRINCLDLSDNGFEYQDAQTLAQLFEAFPPHIEKVILDHEAALSPQEQIAQRIWPESFWTLTALAPNKLEQTSALLNDYTQGDSLFWGFLYSFLKPEHAQASQLLHAIESKLINEEDLPEEAQKLSLKNPTGTLARQFCFLTYHKPRPQAAIAAQNNNELSCW